MGTCSGSTRSPTRRRNHKFVRPSRKRKRRFLSIRRLRFRLGSWHRLPRRCLRLERANFALPCATRLKHTLTHKIKHLVSVSNGLAVVRSQRGARPRTSSKETFRACQERVHGFGLL